MVKRKATFLAPLAIAAAVLPGVWVGAASAAGTPSRGLVRLYQVDNTLTGHSGTVTLTGAIGDFGVDLEASGSVEINVLALQKGAIALDLSNFGSGSQPPPIENPNNCSYTSVVLGTVPIVQGELATSPNPRPPGIYANLSGTFYVKATFAGVVPRVNNTCDFSQETSTATGLDFIEAAGVVSGLPR
jgi:hypothetical protein